jgi:type III secretion system low calcium response chaperone LcrH/SycD
MAQEEKEPEITKELLEKFNEEYKDVDQKKIGEKIGPASAIAGGSAKDTIAALLSEAANKGVMPKHALKLGDDTMEAIYGQAYNLYNQGRYKEASYIFRLLMLLDYMTPKYILGLAACLHRMKDYKNAANIYLLCGTIDVTNPLPHYHAADCYMQLEVPSLALFSLGLAITTAGDQPQFAALKERASLMKEALQKKIKEEVEAAEEPKKEKKPPKKKAEKKKPKKEA